MCLTTLNNRNSEKGLTLIQISLALAVAGILLVPMLQIYQINKMERTRRENSAKLEDITFAMNRFVQQNGFMPAPASSIDSPTSANPDRYGQSADINPTTDCAGMFTDKSVRCFTSTATNTTSGNPSDIVAGAVPFRTLGLSEAQAYDIYGNRLTYVVTRKLLDKTTFKNGLGAITLWNQVDGTPLNDNPMIDKDNTRPRVGPDPTNPDNGKYKVMYVVISHGENGSGAFQRNGTLNPCAAGKDETNCNTATMNGIFRGQDRNIPNPTPGTPTSQPGNFMQDSAGTLYTEAAKTFTLTPGADYYDDMIVYRTTAYDQYWAGLRNLDDPSDTAESVFTSKAVRTAIRTPTGNDTDADKPQAALDVSGNVMAYKLVTETICDANGGECFRTENITAPKTTGETSVKNSINCDNNEALSEIKAHTPTHQEQLQVKADEGTHTELKSAAYVKRTCTFTSVTTTPASNGNLNATTCPNGIKGWNTSGAPICIN